MRCEYCKDDMVDGTTSYLVDRNRHVVVIREVPCIVCEQCGNKMFMHHIGRKVSKMVDVLIGRDEEVSITTYDEMLKEI